MMKSRSSMCATVPSSVDRANSSQRMHPPAGSVRAVVSNQSNWHGHVSVFRAIINPMALNGYSQFGANGLVDDDVAGSVLATWAPASGPIYKQLADALRAAIQRGDLRHGSRLPPERALAERLLISRSTVVA